MLLECLELALQAPTGSNAQGWQWVFVDDPDKKKALADIYRRELRRSVPATLPKPEHGDIRDEQRTRSSDSAKYLTDNFHEAPVLMSRAWRAARRGAAGMSASFWGSLLPAVWSFMLALRARGLGLGVDDAAPDRRGREQAADMLGIPFEKYSQGGLFPIAYTKGTDFRPAKRLPAEAAGALGQLVSQTAPMNPCWRHAS